jgi:tetratricopeptide (TPR) repeat protein
MWLQTGSVSVRSYLTPDDAHPIGKLLTLVSLEQRDPRTRIVAAAPRDMGPEQAWPLRQELVRVLERILTRLELEGEGVLSSFPVMAHWLLSLCYQALGDANQAKLQLDEALAIDPGNEGLLVMRGILQDSSATKESLADFRKAVEMGASKVWPFFFLAHHALVRGRFQECFTYCLGAWKRADAELVRAEIMEWMAICAAEMSSPPEVVRAHFQEALRLAPGHPRISTNLSKYENALELEGQPKTTWETEGEQAAQDIGNAGYRLEQELQSVA